MLLLQLSSPLRAEARRSNSASSRMCTTCVCGGCGAHAPVTLAKAVSTLRKRLGIAGTCADRGGRHEQADDVQGRGCVTPVTTFVEPTEPGVMQGRECTQ